MQLNLKYEFSDSQKWEYEDENGEDYEWEYDSEEEKEDLEDELDLPDPFIKPKSEVCELFIKTKKSLSSGQRDVQQTFRIL